MCDPEQSIRQKLQIFRQWIVLDFLFFLDFSAMESKRGSIVQKVRFVRTKKYILQKSKIAVILLLKRTFTTGPCDKN